MGTIWTISKGIALFEELKLGFQVASATAKAGELTAQGALNIAKGEELATQMKWRLVEGDGEAIYYFGVEDDGEPYFITEEQLNETLDNFNILLEKNNAKIIKYENPTKEDRKIYNN